MIDLHLDNTKVALGLVLRFCGTCCQSISLARMPTYAAWLVVCEVKESDATRHNADWHSLQPATTVLVLSRLSNTQINALQKRWQCSEKNDRTLFRHILSQKSVLILTDVDS